MRAMIVAPSGASLTAGGSTRCTHAASMRRTSSLTSEQMAAQAGGFAGQRQEHRLGHLFRHLRGLHLPQSRGIDQIRAPCGQFRKRRFGPRLDIGPKQFMLVHGQSNMHFHPINRHGEKKGTGISQGLGQRGRDIGCGDPVERLTGYAQVAPVLPRRAAASIPARGHLIF